MSSSDSYYWYNAVFVGVIFVIVDIVEGPLVISDSMMAVRKLFVTVVEVVFVFVLLLSGLWTRKGYETNNEEKRKKKFKPAFVKEPKSHLRLLYLGSTTPLDNHLYQALSNGIDPTPTRT